ncbi:hypothetical protein GPZ77_34525 (plasmid) [Streptomyces sp. QHH-9511]|uniref:hypothetical protein n=1 Tax=Streptomyces sp. QHH-9511 TaxID=2684468 RepID=UPI001318F20B|nr:hypothetical protein [Streptomyces sp. QHH-9511]QGZ53348.1 hypothetical protein GPZ77_34525 [Streptomyces sp. QHH-9511]
MSTPGPDEFDQIIKGFDTPPPSYAPTSAAYDPNPYGVPVQPVKPGLTKRGKAALGIGVAVLAGGSLIGYQSYSAQAAEDAAIAKELELKTQALRLEELKEINRANEIGRKSQTSAETARQASIDSCVNSNKGLVGKGFGSPTYRQVIDDCQAQYGGATNLATDLQTASSTTATNTGTDGGSANGGALLGVGALGLLLLWGARKGAKPSPA